VNSSCATRRISLSASPRIAFGCPFWIGSSEEMSDIDQGIEEKSERRKVEKIPGAARHSGMLRVIEKDYFEAM